jgi:hypothetical protein
MTNNLLKSDINMPLLGRCEATLAQLPDEKREHFLYVPDGHPNSPTYGHLKLLHLN